MTAAWWPGTSRQKGCGRGAAATSARPSARPLARPLARPHTTPFPAGIDEAPGPGPTIFPFPTPSGVPRPCHPLIRWAGVAPSPIEAPVARRPCTACDGRKCGGCEGHCGDVCSCDGCDGGGQGGPGLDRCSRRWRRWQWRTAQWRTAAAKATKAVVTAAAAAAAWRRYEGILERCHCVMTGGTRRRGGECQGKGTWNAGMWEGDLPMFRPA